MLHRVFEIAGTRGHSEAAGVLKAIGLASLTSPEALQFVTMGLSHTNPGVRESALNSIERMPEPTRRTFDSALLRVIGQPDETDDIRERARKVLIK